MDWSSAKGVFGALEHAAARTIINVRTGRTPLGAKAVQLDGQTLDAELQGLLYAMRLSGYSSLSAGGVKRARARMLRDAKVHAGPPVLVGAIRDITLDTEAGPLRARHYVPDEPGGPHPLILFFHGGGFALGSFETHDAPCRVLCKDAGAHVLSVDYRLAPEATFPAAIEDAVASLRWAQKHARELGADPKRIGVAGDSAGANLATVSCLLAAQAGNPVPQLQLLFYPVTDSTTAHRSRELFGDGFFLTRTDIDLFSGLYLGRFEDLADQRVSPLRAKQLVNMPETLIATAGFDPLRDEGEAYGKALHEAGNRVEVRRLPTLIHGFINMGGLSRLSRASTRELAHWARATFRRLHPQPEHALRPA